MVDSLIECPLCKKPYCYQAIDHGKVEWKCLACGYWTSSNFMLNTDYLKAYEDTLPRLYVDIRKVDNTRLVWYPQVIDLTERGIGIVFANGTNHEDWSWTFAPATTIGEEEKEKFKRKDGSYPTYKTDMLRAKHFKKHQFSLAVNELQII